MLLILSLLFCGCHIQTRQGNTSGKSDTTLGQELKSTEAILSGSALNTAKLLCQNLNQKDVSFRQNMLGKKFRMRLINTNCSSETNSVDFDAVLDSIDVNSPLSYAATSVVSFYNFEDTHNQGAVSAICPAVISGDVVSNTVNSGSNKIVFTFTTNKVKVEYATKNGVTLKYLKDKTVEMQISASGVVSNRTETLLCNNGASLIMNQSILSIPN